MAGITAKMSSQDAIVVAAGTAIILTVPPLVAIYCRAYPGGESLLKLVSPFRTGQVAPPEERLAKIAAAREAQRSL